MLFSSSPAISIGSDAGWKVGGGGGDFNNHNKRSLKKALLFCRKVGGLDKHDLITIMLSINMMTIMFFKTMMIIDI